MTPINFGQQFNTTLFTMNLLNSIRPTSDFYSMGFGSTSIFGDAFGANFGMMSNPFAMASMSMSSMPMMSMPMFQMPAFNFNFSSQMPSYNFGSFGTNVRANVNYNCRTSQATNALRLAQSQLGVRENGSSNNSSEVNKYRFGKANGNPWCASFVSYCYGQGQGNSNKATFGFTESSQSIKNQAIKAGKYSTKESGYKPQVGDLAVWSYTKSSGHVGIVASVNKDGSFDVIEGNCGDKVQRCTRSMNTKDLNGFVRMNEWVEA